MNDTNPLFVIVIGLVLRFAIPLLITALAVAFLRKLDARWQAEAENIPLDVEMPKCWVIKNCALEERAQCEAVFSNAPCWQVRRLPNGYLREECLDCEVFYKAPAPMPHKKTIEEVDHVFPL